MRNWKEFGRTEQKPYKTTVGIASVVAEIETVNLLYAISNVIVRPACRFLTVMD
jgi:hypothetical protein